MSDGSDTASTIVEGGESEDGGSIKTIDNPLERYNHLNKFQQIAIYTNTKMTDYVKGKILAYLRKGNTLKDAATLATVAPSTIYRHIKEDPVFATQIGQAMAHFKRAHIENIVSHSKKDAKHSEWLLSRKFADEFGDSMSMNVRMKGEVRVTVTGGGYAPPIVDGELVESGKLHGGSK